MRSKEELIPELEKKAFVDLNGNIWQCTREGKKYIVDFKNNEVCIAGGADGLDRLYDVPYDDFLCRMQALCDYVVESTADDVHEEVEAEICEQPEEAETMPAPVQHQARQMQKMDSDLTNENVRKYICPTATDQEIFMFLKLCEERHLNPFIKEAYLVKYNNSPATLIVGKDAFTKKAEDNPQFDGFEAGVIVKDVDGKLENREGQFVDKGEHLIGGWAKVYRKDTSKPFTSTVSMTEYNTGFSSWKKIPATMIRKVALVQALREAFPSDLGGCYDSAEMDQARQG